MGWFLKCRNSAFIGIPIENFFPSRGQLLRSTFRISSLKLDTHGQSQWNSVLRAYQKIVKPNPQGIGTNYRPSPERSTFSRLGFIAFGKNMKFPYCTRGLPRKRRHSLHRSKALGWRGNDSLRNASVPRNRPSQKIPIDG